MSDQIYQTDLLRLAGAAHDHGRLPQPGGSATLDNPMCGDRVTFDVTLDADGRVQEIAQTTRACVLCQASSSIIATRAPGHTAAELAAVDAAVGAMLKRGSAAPDGTWQALAVFAPVQDPRSRRSGVRVPVGAVSAAVADAQAKGAGQA